MGKVLSIITKKVNRFNIENRTIRFLDKEKLPAAPKYDSTYKDMQRTIVHDPEFLDRSSTKDSILNNRLKKVFVTSKDQTVIESHTENIETKKPLPLNRCEVENFEYGFNEPNKVPIGRCTLRQAMKFIIDHQSDPSTFSAGKIAKEYKIKHDKVENILLFFKSFQVHIPSKTLKESILQQSTSNLIGSSNEKT